MTEKVKQQHMFSNKMIAGILIPVVLEQLLNSIMGTADTMMVSNIGSAAISAVSLVDSINILVIQAFSALAAGGAIVCSQYIGQQNKKMANESARQVLFIITAISIAVSVLCLGFKKPLLRLIFGSVEADVMRASETYFFYTAISFPFIAAYDSAASIFRAQENTKGPMLISMISNAMNIVGNAIMIWIFHMGVAGAAISTLVSRIFCAVVVLIQLRKDRQPIVVRDYLKIRPDWAMIRRILGIGIPSGVENSMFQLGKIAVLSLVSGLGTASLAANAVSNNIANFAILPGMSFGFALLTVCAQCVGAGDFEQVKYYTRHMMRVENLCLIATNLIVILSLPFILSIYNLSDEAAMYTNDIILYHAACVVTIWPLSFTLPNTLRAAADVKVTMVLSIISMWVFRFGFSYLLTMEFHMGIFGVWVAMTIDWLVRGIFFVCRYKSGRWQKIIFS